MKQTTFSNFKVLLVALCFVLAKAGFAAEPVGSVHFNTHVTGVVDAKVSRPDGTGAGAGVQAQLFLVGSDAALIPLTPSTTFRTESAAAAYYVNQVTVAVPGRAPGQPATLRMRAWSGSSYETSPLRGESGDFIVMLGGELLPPANLTGLTSFALSGAASSTVTITASAGANGSISPSGRIIRSKGESISFTATPNRGFSVEAWTVNGTTAQKGGASFTLANVRENRSVSVSFRRNENAPSLVTITASAGANGSINPNGTFTKVKGQSQTFAATPARGFAVDKWSVNGSVVQTGGAIFTLSNVQENRSVLVTFKEQQNVSEAGLVNFNTHVTGVVEAKVSRPDGSGAGEGVKAQLFIVGPEGRLIALHPRTSFRTTSPEAAYFVNPVEVPVPGTSPGKEVVLRIRAWTGDSYESSRLRGESKDLAVILGGGILPPANLVGLEGFFLTEATAGSIPFIVEQPKSLKAHLGSTVSFSVKAVGSGPLSYQWKRGDTAIDGATAATLTLKNVKASDEGTYSVLVSNAIGSTASASAHLKVKRRAIGDFDDDGNPDIILMHRDRTLAFWLMNGINIRAGLTPYKLADGWKIVGTGDFNKDGKTDVLLQNENRSLAFWFMNGTAIVQGVVPLSLPEGWHVAATADFNNDDQTDILLRNGEGSLAFWLMDGTTVAQVVEAAFDVPEGWHIIGAGDFNNDGETDILLRHSNRSLAFWLMKGTTMNEGLVRLRVPEGWKVIGLGDFNHDGQTDIMLRHSAHWLAFWFMNGLDIGSGAVPIQEPEGWEVVGNN